MIRIDINMYECISIYIYAIIFKDIYIYIYTFIYVYTYLYHISTIRPVLVAGWVDVSFRANLTGACDKWCKSSVERDPSIRATLKNPSPLLAAGEDTEAALPGDSLEDGPQPWEFGKDPYLKVVDLGSKGDA